jgi:hypothetical protein
MGAPPPQITIPGQPGMLPTMYAMMHLGQVVPEQWQMARLFPPQANEAPLSLSNAAVLLLNDLPLRHWEEFSDRLPTVVQACLLGMDDR